MGIIDWITVKRPGRVYEYDNRYEIIHDSGEHSTLFKNITGETAEALSLLGDIYIKYDGIDLFSSTFKISAMTSNKSIEGVEIIESLQNFEKYVSSLNPVFPEIVIPFMYQAGIGIYAIGTSSGLIYEWDSEESTITGEYSNLEEIFDQWLEAID